MFGSASDQEGSVKGGKKHLDLNEYKYKYKIDIFQGERASIYKYIDINI